ncbi:MAG: hypothetical protein KDC70_00085 [Saprospiraceae bacterium]|nr:hypothetical protein [Saprospiraceae bacterium]
MKRLVFAALAALTFLSCSKDDNGGGGSACTSCLLTLTNAEQYPYEVTFFNWGADAPGTFTLQPGGTASFQMPANKDITIDGDLQTGFAHNDFSMTVRCPGDCGTRVVIMKM